MLLIHGKSYQQFKANLFEFGDIKGKGKMKKSFLILIFLFAAIFTICASSGKIVIVGDIHEFLNENDVKKMINAAGKGGLLIIPGDFLHHPYHNASMNPPGMPINDPHALKLYDQKIISWFKKHGADQLAGIALILGNHDFSRGQKEAISILKNLSKKIKILDGNYYDFIVNGYVIRVIGYSSSWRYEKGKGKEAQTGKRPIDSTEQIQKIINTGVSSTLSTHSKPYGIILMTHEGGQKNHDRDGDDLALAAGLRANNLVIVGGHTHNIITFSGSKNGKYELFRRLIHLDKQEPYHGKSHSWQKDVSIPILKTGWHNQRTYSVWFPKGNSVSCEAIE